MLVEENLTSQLTKEDEPDENPAMEPEGSFAWKTIDPAQTKLMLGITDEVELEKSMATVMQIKEYDLDLKEACLLDFYLSCFHWAKEQKFKEKQLSGFITMIEKLMINLRKNRCSKLECFIFIKQCLVGVGEDVTNLDAAFPLYFLTLEQAKQIISFLSRTLLLNFSLYEHVFGNDQDEIIVGKEMTVEFSSNSVKFPPPLEEAVHMKTYQKNILRLEHQEGDEDSEDDEFKDQRTDEERFVDSVVDQILDSEHPAAMEIGVDELRRTVEKFSKGVLTPNKRALEDKIKDKEAVLLERIASDQPPPPGAKSNKSNKKK